VIFTVLPEAQSEVDLAAAWYDAQSLGLGDGFLDELRRAYGVIRRQPLSFPRVRPRGSRREFRQYVLRHFAYSVIYEVAGPDLLIIAVSHNQRRQFYWRHRRAP
jgi:hypothetical protein